MLYEEMVNTRHPSDSELVSLQPVSLGCLIIEVLLKKQELNDGGGEVCEAWRSKGVPLLKDRGSYAVKVES